jgi:hypothetical protein
MQNATENAAQHLLAWFTEERKKLISSRALDTYAGRPVGTFSRFLARQPGFTFTRTSLRPYYPFLKLLGYEPPTS